MIERREFEMEIDDKHPMLAGETPVTYARRRIDALKEGWAIVRVDYQNERVVIDNYASRVPHEILFQGETLVVKTERFRSG